MYFPSLPNPRAFELASPSAQALFREEYMTKRRKQKLSRRVAVAQPADTTSISIVPLLGTQWFAFP